MTDIFEKRIQERAYFLWEQVGRPEGKAHEHWAIAARLELKIKTRAGLLKAASGRRGSKLADFLGAAEEDLH